MNDIEKNDKLNDCGDNDYKFTLLLDDNVTQMNFNRISKLSDFEKLHNFLKNNL